MKSIFVVFWLCVAVTAASGQPVDSTDLWKRLERLGRGEAPDELAQAVDELRSVLPTSKDARERAIRGLAEDSLACSVRLRLLDVLGDGIDADSAMELLVVAGRWIDATSSWTAVKEDRTEYCCRSELIDALVELLCSDRRLAIEIRSRVETLLFLRGAVTSAKVDIAVLSRAIVAMTKFPASDDRRRIVEAMIEERLRAEGRSFELHGMLNKASIPRLRALIPRNATAGDLHWGAASALAHLGDCDVRQQFLEMAQSVEATDRNQSNRLRYYAWQIDVQETPEKLLACLGSTDYVFEYGRSWIVVRAIELGVPKPALRDAILKHAASAKPITLDGLNGATYTLQPRDWLIDLKQTACQRGVLEKEDIPTIDISPRKGWTP